MSDPPHQHEKDNLITKNDVTLMMSMGTPFHQLIYFCLFQNGQIIISWFDHQNDDVTLVTGWCLVSRPPMPTPHVHPHTHPPMPTPHQLTCGIPAALILAKTSTLLLLFSSLLKRTFILWCSIILASFPGLPFVLSMHAYHSMITWEGEGEVLGTRG